MSGSDERRKRVERIEIVEKKVFNEEGFLRLWRTRLRNVYEDGTASREYTSDMVHRRGVDSVAIIPYYFDGDGKLTVFLKQGIRPPIYFRRELPLAVQDRSDNLYTREAIAGSLEEGDRDERSILRRAREELLEELGFKVGCDEFEKLGAGFYPSHGQSSEKIHLLAIRVKPEERMRSPGNGSVNEEDSITVAIEARKALEMCREGDIEDPKIEIGITRLCKKLRYS